jgi:hypothetical protein
MKKTKKFLAVMLLAFMVLAVAVPVFARNNGQSMENIFVAQNELVPYNFVVAGSVVDFQGEAQKDVIVAGGTVNISGPVHGDVIVGGGNVVIDGNVDGNVRVIGGTIAVNGRVGKNVTIAGGNITLGNNSEIGWDAMIGGGSVIMKGKVGGDVNIGAGTLTLGGEVGGNVKSYVGDDGSLNILPDTKIDGNLDYWSVSEIKMPENAVISGEVVYNSTFEKAAQKSRRNFLSVYVFGIIISIFSALIIGLVVVSLFREQALKITNKMVKHPFSSLLWGFVYLIMIPIVSFVFLIFIVTIPLSVIVMLLYGLALYLTNIFVAILIGRQILKFNKKSSGKEGAGEKGDDKSILMKSMIVGVIIYVLVINIPVVGWIIRILAVIWALGAVGRVFSVWVSKKVGADKKV